MMAEKANLGSPYREVFSIELLQLWKAMITDFHSEWGLIKWLSAKNYHSMQNFFWPMNFYRITGQNLFY